MLGFSSMINNASSLVPFILASGVFRCLYGQRPRRSLRDLALFYRIRYYLATPANLSRPWSNAWGSNVCTCAIELSQWFGCFGGRTTPHLADGLVDRSSRHSALRGKSRTSQGAETYTGIAYQPSLRPARVGILLPLISHTSRYTRAGHMHGVVPNLSSCLT
ncbi:hypothetical protein BDN67DRAFT_806544 [Paxillus ammoniavirescens]|nr:hypothetical protein BDN67DRAFT_806544 [Paxillus ammoniavirescens]